MITVESTEKVLEQAIASYSKMPFETAQLYKKYVLNFPIPQGDAEGGTDLEKLRTQIANESRLRFDLYNGKEGTVSSSEFVKVSGKKQNDYREDANAGFEERLGAYVSSRSKNSVEIDIPAGREAKLNFLFLCDSSNAPVQVVANIGDGSRLSLFEWFGSASDARCASTTLHVINAGSRSNVEINMLHNEGLETGVGALNRVSAGEDSVVRMNGIYNGGKLTRSSTFAEASGRGSNLLVNEIVLGNAEQKFDINTFILNSNQQTKAVLKTGAVLKGKSFCILKGYAKVAEHTNGSYSNVEERGLVLDPDARIQPLPDMSIDCKDVAFASHSASTAPLDKEALFYLMSRGIDETKAKRIFVASFLSKYLADIENDIVKEIAISILLDKLDNDRHTPVPKISMQNLWIVPKKR
ncbi:MAG: SufD family Fe-S cluster assembly protein [Candidatus Micrarchaeota archaeon]|nr:SufD family Fe-S cluster assembly protein [Candidatus Micrarchaeota archaeon]